MPPITRLAQYSVHVPSIARARILPTFFLRRPQIYIQYFNGSDAKVNYPFGNWSTAQKDFERLLKSMDRCQEALSSVNFYDIIQDKERNKNNTEKTYSPPQLEQPVKYRISPPSVA